MCRIIGGPNGCLSGKKHISPFFYYYTGRLKQTATYCRKPFSQPIFIYRFILQGDSGGPLVCLNGTSAILTGVTSYGYDCGNHPGYYSGFARVTTALDWIELNMVCIKLGYICM